MKIPQNKIKQKLKDYYKYLDSDFYQDEENIYMNCQDNVGILAIDLWETLEQERKEEYIVDYWNGFNFTYNDNLLTHWKRK